MRIVYDAKRFFNNRTGLGNYSRTLIGDMARLLRPQDQMFLFTPGHIPKESALPHSGTKIEVQSLRPLGKLKRFAGISRPLRKIKAEIYHGLSNELPLDIRRTSIPSVVTIHDVIFKTQPEDYPVIDRLIYHFKTALALKNATQIVAISTATKRDLVYHYHINPDKILVIYQSIQALYREEKTMEKPVIPEDIPEGFLLCVGSLSPRKNQLQIIEALGTISYPERPFIVFIGRGKDHYVRAMKSRITALGLNRNTRILTDVKTRHLPGWYRSARASIYLSVYEGFGLPVVESLACGTPVIASDVPAVREAAGDCAALISPFEIEAIREALLHPPALDKCRTATHLMKFSPDNITAQWLKLYDKLRSKG